ncbi:MAG: hypothetical protein Q9183_004292 [Haloplaca sp. 2 TL-2023]
MPPASSTSRPEGSQEPNGEQVNEGRPSFTAVNGSTSPAPQPKPKEQPKDEKIEDSNRPSRAESLSERPRSPVPVMPALERVNGQPDQKPSPPPRDQAEDRPPQVYSHPHDNIHQPPNNHPRAQSSQQSNNGNNGVQKRKRSYPDDDYDQANNSTYHNHGLPPSPQRQRMYSQDSGSVRDHGTPDNYGRHDRGSAPELYPRPERSPPPAGNYPQPERHSLVRNEYDHRGDGAMASGRPYYSTEARMAEALQRENNSYDSMQVHESQFGSPDDDDDNHAHQYGDYGASRTPQTQAQRDLERTRRKRVFSNRTKTGCMTCRRRKKKCDEQHPECNNCLRGGFVCEGYSVRNTWQKPANTKVPIPLQSKNGGYPPPPLGRNGPSGYVRYSDGGPDYPGPPPMGQSMHPAHEGAERMKPIHLDDERNQDYNTSPPDGPGKPSPYAKAARPYPSNPPYASKYQIGEPGDERPPSNHENAPYAGPDPNSMQPPSNVGRNNSIHSQYSAPSSQPPPHSSVQGIAQTALHLRPSPPQRRNDMVERDKMLKGNYYSPFSPALTQDRENCMAAVWRFNNATNPSHGASPEERQRRFREIMACRPTPEPTPSANGNADAQPNIMPVGRVGSNVAVEAPFHCDYGYNINIGNDVLIGADCRISDTCSVTIGDRCIFSPNVKLVCATYPIDPRRRQGSSGQALGRNIVIEEDCWIGSNVTILAGVRVGKSSTVGAGSLLHQDVPRFTVVAGNPAKVSRGIYDGSADQQ